MNAESNNDRAAAERLTGIVISGDWFARSLLRSAATETGVFRTVIEADDGYTALAEAWQAVEDGEPPDVIVIDLQASDASAARLVAELRNNPELQETFVATIGEPDAEHDIPVPESDFSSPCGVLHESLADMLGEIAARALGSPQPRR